MADSSTSRFFTDEYARLAGRAAIGEDESSYRSREFLREKVVKCIWFDQRFDTAGLRADDGRKLTVFSTGWWNLEGGPDFRDAIVRLGKEGKVRGDVEIHLRTSDWKLHKHHESPDYDSVVLHCVLWNDTGEATVTTVSGRAVAQLTLESYLDEGIEGLCEAFDPSEYPPEGGARTGACHPFLQSEEGLSRFSEFLDWAGDERILSKARRLMTIGQDRSSAELLYVAVMEALGFKRNRQNFVRLAGKLPLAVGEELREPDAVQAALFGLSGLLPAGDLPDEADEEARSYADRLGRLWAAIRIDAEPLDAAEWFFKGTRPQNFPTRRIAAAARLFPFSTFLERAVELVRSKKGGQIMKLLCQVSDPFWDWRCTFAGKKLARRLGLIGVGRARAIIVDAIVPSLLAHARRTRDPELEAQLHDFYNSFPKLPESSVTRLVEARVLGSARGRVVNSARRQQGLYQLFKDFCQQDRSGCATCAFMRLMSETKRQ